MYLRCVGLLSENIRETASLKNQMVRGRVDYFSLG